MPLKIAQRNTFQPHQRRRLAGPADLFPQAVRRRDRAAWLVGALAAILNKPAGKRSKAETDELLDYWLRIEDKIYQQLTAQLAGAEQEQAVVRAAARWPT